MELPSPSSLSRCSAANSVGTPREFAAFGSGPDAKHRVNYSRASSLFFSVHNHGFCGGPNTLSHEEHLRVYLDRAAMSKESYKS